MRVYISLIIEQKSKRVLNVFKIGQFQILGLKRKIKIQHEILNIESTKFNFRVRNTVLLCQHYVEQPASIIPFNFSWSLYETCYQCLHCTDKEAKTYRNKRIIRQIWISPTLSLTSYKTLTLSPRYFYYEFQHYQHQRTFTVI